MANFIFDAEAIAHLVADAKARIVSNRIRPYKVPYLYLLFFSL
ncbi:MAG TPA: hypothetical protein V6D50_03550 [Chroococcales cyanobacterium]